MGQIEDLKLFTKIVELGSISRAAEALHIAKSAVSRRLNLLEERYGGRLIDRKPGHWEITNMGMELHRRAQRVVGEVDDIASDFTESTQSLAGPLAVSLPREFGLSYLTPALMEFKKRHPEIQLMVDFDDRKVDLARDSYDIAVRITLDPGTNNAVKKIGSTGHMIFAAPSYLSRMGLPKEIQDLKSHHLLQFGSTRRTTWSFIDADEKDHSVEFQAFLNSNSGMFLLEAALQGLGLARLPDFICASAVESGALVPILRDYRAPEFGIYLLYAQGRRLNRRMQLFAEELEATCPSCGCGTNTS